MIAVDDTQRNSVRLMQAPLQIARGAIRPSIIVEGIGMFDDSPAGRKAISKIRWWHYVIGYGK